jgi:hypothetical protein
MDRIASVDIAVMEELRGHRDRVGRELTSDEMREILRCPSGYARCMKRNAEHLKARGWTLVPGLTGWQRAH